jgi:hypothetical protein
MLNVIKASLLGSALMFVEGCANLQSYQTPCVPGHVCECEGGGALAVLNRPVAGRCSHSARFRTIQI